VTAWFRCAVPFAIAAEGRASGGRTPSIQTTPTCRRFVSAPLNRGMAVAWASPLRTGMLPAGGRTAIALSAATSERVRTDKLTRVRTDRPTRVRTDVPPGCAELAGAWFHWE